MQPICRTTVIQCVLCTLMFSFSCIVQQSSYLVNAMATPIDSRSSQAILMPEGGQNFHNIPQRHQLQRNTKLSILFKFFQLVRKNLHFLFSLLSNFSSFMNVITHCNILHKSSLSFLRVSSHVCVCQSFSNFWCLRHTSDINFLYGTLQLE
jgi:hypothetical protein